jgi:hypothetical protein
MCSLCSFVANTAAAVSSGRVHRHEGQRKVISMSVIGAAVAAAV